MLVDGTLRTVLDPRTAEYTVRVPFADVPEGSSIRVRAVAAVDGEEQSAEFVVSGGKHFDKSGAERTEAVLTWTLPHGFFGTKDVPANEYANLRARRWGETAKSSFTLRTEVEPVRGLFPDLAAAVRTEVVSRAADPTARYHHSIAIENATSAAEDGGDGTISVSFTANTGSNRAALVVSGSDRSGQVGSHTVTYGGAAASIARAWNVTDSSYSRCTGDVFIDTEIGSGAKTVQNVCDLATDGGTTIAVLCLSGVDQTVPVGTAVTAASTSASSGSVTVLSVNSTDVVVDGLYIFNTSATAGANQTTRTAATAGFNTTQVTTQSGADGGVMSWSGGSGAEYTYGAVAFKEATVVTTTPAAMGYAARLNAGPMVLRARRRRPLETFPQHVAGAVDVSVALTGQAATTAQGAMAPSSAVALTGQSVTTAQGTLTPTVTEVFLWTPPAGPRGRRVGPMVRRRRLTVPPAVFPSVSNVTAALSGQQVTTAQGTLGVTSAVPLTGQAAATAQGSMAPSSAVALTGQSVTTAQGTLTPAVTALYFWTPPVVRRRRFGAGPAVLRRPLTVPPSGWPSVSDVTVALTGQAATSAQGTLSPSTDVALSGQAATSAQGTLSPSITVTPSGIAITTAQGTLSPSITVTPSGIQVVTSQGTMTPVITSTAPIVYLPQYPRGLNVGPRVLRRFRRSRPTGSTLYVVRGVVLSVELDGDQVVITALDGDQATSLILDGDHVGTMGLDLD